MFVALARDLADRIPQKHRGTIALGLVLIGSTGIQTTTAFVAPLFEHFAPVSITGMRMLIAATFLALIVRPNPFALKKQDWPQVLIYACVAALMTVFYYSAVKYIPLGIAVTFEFLGAFFVALLGVRRYRDALLTLGALVGVVLIAGPTFGHYPLTGYIFASANALTMAGYTLLSANMGRSSEATSGLKGVTISLCIAAVALLPWSAPQIPHLDGDAWLRLACAGIFGVALAFSADSLAGRLTSSAVIGILFSLDPVVGSIAGWLILGEVLGFLTYLGIACIVVSGALLVWQTNRSGIKVSTDTVLLDAVVSTKTGQLPIIKKD